MASSVNDFYCTYWREFRKNLVACNPPFEPLRSPAGNSPARYPLVWIANDNIWVKVEVACSLQKGWVFAQIALIKTDKWKTYERLKPHAGAIESGLKELRIKLMRTSIGIHIPAQILHKSASRSTESIFRIARNGKLSING